MTKVMPPKFWFDTVYSRLRGHYNAIQKGDGVSRLNALIESRRKQAEYEERFGTENDDSVDGLFKIVEVVQRQTDGELFNISAYDLLEEVLSDMVNELREIEQGSLVKLYEKDTVDAFVRIAKISLQKAKNLAIKHRRKAKKEGKKK